ncbi:hypothetical protein HK105_209015 [Polyrhizophydium stewartii]|uniref:Non-specific serine/threonine protein kinase n=1 Tax=Polyrhizophydium stewartii TaxID=2732419 RepID=A0ABR4MW98_9FUNG
MDAWTADQVAAWMASLGLRGHEQVFRDNNITGDILVHADHEMLRELGIAAVGQRIALLKAIYNHKVQSGIPFEEDDYVPEAAASSNMHADIQRLEDIVCQQASTIDLLTSEVASLANELRTLREELKPVWPMLLEYKQFQHKPITNAPVASGAPSKEREPKAKTSGSSKQSTASIIITSFTSGSSKSSSSKSQGRETESYKSIRVHLNDTCAKLLPEVLAKYKLQDEDWRQYALFIQFRNAERCLSFNERPLYLVNQLREGDETPEFSIRHIKQVNTPGVRISTLEPEALQAAPQGEGLAGHDAAAPSSATPNGKQDGFGDPANAVAIFEYTAQRADEFDVAIGDQFTIIARDTGWFVVEKAGRRGWVPAGCLLESRGSEGGQIDTQDLNQPGMALFDYEKNSPNELTIRKGDALVVHRKYQHWLLAECNGDQGWVPSCYVAVSGSLDSAKKLGSSLALTDVREQPEREQGDASSRSLAQATAFGTSPSRDVGRAQSEKQATSKEAASSPASVATGLAGRAEPFGSAGQSEQATQKRGRASSETLRTASDRSPGGPASAAARQAAVGNTALSKLSSLLDTINPFMAETRSASPSAPAASSLYISQTPSASALAAYSAGPSAHSYSPLAGAGSGIAVSGPTPDLSGAERSSQLRSEDALAKPGNRDVAVLGQLLQQTDMLLAEFQGEISINVAGIPASGAKVERLVSVREMMNVLAARLGAHGTHTISPAAYTSVVRSLDALSENIGMRLTELRDHAVAHAAGGQSQDGLRGDAVFRRIAKERDDIIQDSIDHTYNSLTRIVGLLLEDARNTQRANSAAAQPLAASEAAAAGVVPNADGSGYGSPKSTPVGALQHQSSTQSLRAPPPDDKSASAGIGIGIGIGIGLGLGLGIGSVGGERSVELQRELQARMRSIQVARRAATPEPEIEVATPVSAAPSGSMSAGAFGGAMPWSSGASVVSSASLASAGSAAIQGGDGSGRAGTAAPGSPHPFANDDATQQQHQQQRFALLDPNEVFEELPYSVVIQRKDLNQNFLERYLSNEDCLKHLGYSKADLAKLPAWKLSHLKREMAVRSPETPFIPQDQLLLAPQESPQDRSAAERVIEESPNRRYAKLNQILGKGAYKIVFKAIDREEGYEVAWNTCQTTKAEFMELGQEIEILKRVRHPNIIQFYDCWFQTSEFVFITELMTSGTLREYIRKLQIPNLKIVKRWSRQILKGLSYLHSHDPPIIHRDIKCDNIFINGAYGEVKIGDMGTAKMKLGKKYTLIGTPEFMAPEMYEDKGYSEKVDIYALGMALLEMVTGEYPYSECKNAAQIYKKVIQGIKPECLSRVTDPEVKDLIVNCITNENDRLTAQQIVDHPFLAVEPEVVLLSSEKKPMLIMQVVFKGMDKLSVTFEFNVDTDTAEAVVNEMIQEQVLPAKYQNLITTEINRILREMSRPPASEDKNREESRQQVQPGWNTVPRAAGPSQPKDWHSLPRQAGAGPLQGSPLGSSEPARIEAASDTQIPLSRRASVAEFNEFEDIPAKEYSDSQPIADLVTDVAVATKRGADKIAEWLSRLNTQDIMTVGDLRDLQDEDWSNLGLTVFASRALKNALYGKPARPSVSQSPKVVVGSGSTGSTGGSSGSGASGAAGPLSAGIAGPQGGAANGRL